MLTKLNHAIYAIPGYRNGNIWYNNLEALESFASTNDTKKISLRAVRKLEGISQEEGDWRIRDVAQKVLDNHTQERPLAFGVECESSRFGVLDQTPVTTLDKVLAFSPIPIIGELAALKVIETCADVDSEDFLTMRAVGYGGVSFLAGILTAI